MYIIELMLQFLVFLDKSGIGVACVAHFSQFRFSDFSCYHVVLGSGPVGCFFFVLVVRFRQYCITVSLPNNINSSARVLVLFLRSRVLMRPSGQFSKLERIITRDDHGNR